MLVDDWWTVAKRWVEASICAPRPGDRVRALVFGRYWFTYRCILLFCSPKFRFCEIFQTLHTTMISASRSIQIRRDIFFDHLQLNFVVFVDPFHSIFAVKTLSESFFSPSIQGY